MVLRKAQEAYERYLSLLDTYDILSKNDRKLYERYIENRDEFSLISSNDPGARRDTKIARFKQENELKLKLQVYLSFALARRPPNSNSVPLQSPVSTPRRRCRSSRNLPRRNPALCPPLLPRPRPNSPRAQNPRPHAPNTPSRSPRTRG